MSDQCGTVAMVKSLPHDGDNAVLNDQAATSLGGILQSSPGKPNVAASSRVIPSAEQQSPTTQAKQQPEQHETEGFCQTVSMTLSTQETHSIGHEKSVNPQNLVPASMPTDPADSRPESDFTKSALSVEHPAFAQPLPRHKPDKSRQNNKAKTELLKLRGRTPSPGASLPLSVLSQRRNESVGIEWKCYENCFVGNPSKGFYDRNRLSVSPERGTSVDLFGLPMPTEEARDMAKAMKLPPDFADTRIRSRTPRRVRVQKHQKAISNVTLPSPKRKLSATSEPGNRKKGKQDVTASDVFAAEGQDHDDFIRSRFTPEILKESGLACGWCLGAKCLCVSKKMMTEDDASQEVDSTLMAREARPMLLAQPSTLFTKLKHDYTTHLGQRPVKKSSDTSANTAPALSSIAKRAQFMLETIIEQNRKGDPKSVWNCPVSRESISGSTVYAEISSQDDYPTMKSKKSISEATDQRSSCGKDTTPSPTLKHASRAWSPPAVKHKTVDDSGLISPVSRGSSFPNELVGQGLADQSGLDGTAASVELISPLPQRPSSSSRSALLESSAQEESEDAAVADELMPPLSRCPPSLSRSSLLASSTQDGSEDTAVVGELMPPEPRCPHPSSELALLESSIQAKGKDLALPDESMQLLPPRPPPTPRPRSLELPTKVLASSSIIVKRQDGLPGSGGLRRRRASIRASPGSETPMVLANNLEAHVRRYKLFKRRRNRRKPMSYAKTLDRVLEQGRREHKSYFVVMAELRHKRIQANLLARQYRFFQSSNGVSGPSAQTVALSKLFDRYRGSENAIKFSCHYIG